MHGEMMLTISYEAFQLPKQSWIVNVQERESEPIMHLHLLKESIIKHDSGFWWGFPGLKPTGLLSASPCGGQEIPSRRRLSGYNTESIPLTVMSNVCQEWHGPCT